MTANSTAALGGGIYSTAFNLSVVSSTISGNSAAGIATAGGIHTTSTTFTLLNSTVSGNSSTAVTGNNAGGMLGSGTMINSTITNNSVANPDPAIVGGVGGGFAIANSLVAANVGNTARPDVGGFFTSNGGNVIGNGGTATGFTHGVNGDQVGSGAAVINPLLGTLADNGGLTLTHMLLNGSPAINNGLAANLPADTFDVDGDTNVAEALPLDQRGGVNLRTRGPAPDAGAVEAFAFEPTISASPATLEDTQTTSGLVITANTADGGLTTHYQITGITAGTLFKNDGTTVIAENDFITKAEGTAGLKFTPALNLNNTTTPLFGFTVQAAVGTTAGDQRGATVSTTISVTPVNDAPTVVAPGIPDQTVTVGTPVVVALPAHFNDVELDKLTFTVQGNSDAAKATAAITGGTNVTLTALAYGDTNVTIQADDGNGGTVTDTFTVFARTVDPTGTMDAPPNPPGVWVFSPLNGLFNTTATVQNTTANSVNGMRLTVNVTAYLAAHPSLRLWNATRTIAPGIFEIDYPYPVASQASVKFNLNFYTSTRQFPNPFAPVLTVVALPVSAVPGPLPAGLTFVASEIRLNTAGRMVLEWASTYGKWYRIYYNDGLDPNQWLPCTTPIQAGSNRQQWSDEGAPFTATPPGAARFYRVTEIAAP